MDLRRTQSDVFIVGAGPAGLACAIAAARQGLQVEVIDAAKAADRQSLRRRSPSRLTRLPRRTWLRPQARPASHRKRLPRRHPFHRRLHVLKAPPLPCSATFLLAPDAAFAAPSSTRFCSIAPPALEFVSTGRTLCAASRSTEISPQFIPRPRTFRTRYLIGADGHQSRVAAFAGLTASTIHSRRIGLRQHYTVAPWTDFVEVYWSNIGQAYVTPTSSNEVCVAFVANKKFASPEDALAYFPTLRHHLAASQPNGPPRGSITLGRKLRRVTTGNIALIGDASGSVDAITGEGMALCFRQAARARPGTAIGQSRLLPARPPQHSATPLSDVPNPAADGPFYAAFEPSIFSTFERNPALFSSILQLHVGNHASHLFGEDGLLAAGFESAHKLNLVQQTPGTLYIGLRIAVS